MQVKLIAATLLLAAAFLAGWQTNQWRLDGQIARMERNEAKAMTNYVNKVRETEAKLQEATDEISKNQAALIEKERKHELDIKRAVAKYQASRHTADANDACRHLDADWVRIHNSSASGVPSVATTTSGSIIAAPAAALDTVTSNYAIANSCLRKLSAWQEWWERVGQK